MREGFKYFTDIHLTIFALMLFFSWFLWMCYRVFSISKQHHQQMADLPLQDEEIV